MRFIVLAAVLIVANGVLWFALDQGKTEAIVTFGDPSSVALFDKETVLSDPAFGADGPKVDQYGRLSLFLAILGIEATLLVAFLFPGSRFIIPTNLRVGANKQTNVLCIGLGGTGKTTLIENVLMDNETDPLTSIKFETYSTTRHVRNELTNLTVFDPIGQDWADLVKQVIDLERDKGVIDHLVIMIGIAGTEPVGAGWQLSVPDDLASLTEGSIVSDQRARLREEVLGPIVYNLVALKRITVLYNQVDLFAERNPGGMSINLDMVRSTYHACFSTIADQIEEISGKYDERKNSDGNGKSSILKPKHRHERVDLRFLYCSVKWGIALNPDTGEINPLTRPLLY